MKMEDIQWWHKVPLKDGRVTPGPSRVAEVEHDFFMDSLDFKGKSVADLGCWDGYHSFMAEQRGASRVVAMDDLNCRGGGPNALDGFNFLHDHFQSHVIWRQHNIYQPLLEQFDIVLCYGILYHLSDPLLAALNVFKAAKETAVFEGLFHDTTLPTLSLLDGHYCNDRSNIYVPSTGWLKSVGAQCGFELEETRMTPGDRGAMLFKRVYAGNPTYIKTCFPL